MKIHSLGRLACPAPQCKGELSVDDSFPSELNVRDAELTEGLLRCRRCRADYPVILGVALLVVDLQQYFWAFWPEIERWGRQLTHGYISRGMLKHLGVASAHMGHAGPPTQDGEGLDWTVSPYLQAHGDRDSMTHGLPDGWWRTVVDGYGEGGPDPYRYLLDAAGRHRPNGHAELAIEVGSGIGWGASQMAGTSIYSMGFDWSFTAVLTARRYFLSSPSSLDRYSLEMEKGSLVDRPLEAPAEQSNLDFVVADGGDLPLAAAKCSRLAALNVLCAVPKPNRLFQEFARVVRTEGLLLLATPYWADEGVNGESAFARGGPAFTRSVLLPEFRILEEADMVPWLLRLAQRRWNVYLSHCLLAERK